jgi:hypothetical protein
VIISIDTVELRAQLESNFPGPGNRALIKHAVACAALKAIASKCDRAPVVELSGEALRFLQNGGCDGEDINAYLRIFSDMLSPECRGFIEPEYI